MISSVNLLDNLSPPFPRVQRRRVECIPLPRDNATTCIFLHDVIYDLATMKGIQEPKIEKDSVSVTMPPPVKCRLKCLRPAFSLLWILESCVRVDGECVTDGGHRQVERGRFVRQKWRVDRCTELLIPPLHVRCPSLFSVSRVARFSLPPLPLPPSLSLSVSVCVYLCVTLGARLPREFRGAHRARVFLR